MTWFKRVTYFFIGVLLAVLVAAVSHVYEAVMSI